MCRLFIIFICLSWVGVTKNAMAQSMSITQGLDFGEAVVIDNDSVHSITVTSGGVVSADPEFLIITNPQPAIVQVTGGTPGQAISSVVVTVSTNPNAAGQNFTLDNFTTTYPSNLDGAGEALIYVGGRMNTSGAMTNYNANTTFNGDLDITINF